MSARKRKTVPEEQEWVEFDLQRLNFTVRDLSFVNGHHVNRIPGFMTHVAKAVAELEWMIKVLENSASPREEKEARP